MRFFTQIALVAVAAFVFQNVNAQRPANESICDYYTTTLLMNNTAENQMTVLTLVVNTAVIGNYTKPNVGIMVPGILAQGQMQEGIPVDLLKYFNGSLMSTNRNGVASSVNFLDDGGAAPLMMNKPANTNTSARYFLLTHLYQYFGTLLGCSMQGMAGFNTYQGSPSQYQVHKFMNLTKYEMDYFITQVGLAAASFGVAADDVMAVGMALNDTFNQRCSAPAAVIPAQGAQLQAICIAPDCALATSAVCDQYSAAATSGSMMSGSATGMMSPSATQSGAMPTGAGGSAGVGGASATGAVPVGTSVGNVVFIPSAVWTLLTSAFVGAFGFAIVF